MYFILCDSTVPDELNDLLVCAGFLGEGVSLVLILRGEQLFATWSLYFSKIPNLLYLLYFKVSLAWKPIFLYILFIFHQNEWHLSMFTETYEKRCIGSGSGRFKRFLHDPDLNLHLIINIITQTHKKKFYTIFTTFLPRSLWKNRMNSTLSSNRTRQNS